MDKQNITNFDIKELWTKLWNLQELYSVDLHKIFPDIWKAYTNKNANALRDILAVFDNIDNHNNLSEIEQAKRVNDEQISGYTQLLLQTNKTISSVEDYIDALNINNFNSFREGANDKFWDSEYDSARSIYRRWLILSTMFNFFFVQASEEQRLRILDLMLMSEMDNHMMGDQLLALVIDWKLNNFCLLKIIDKYEYDCITSGINLFAYSEEWYKKKYYRIQLFIESLTQLCSFDNFDINTLECFKSPHVNKNNILMMVAQTHNGPTRHNFLYTHAMNNEYMYDKTKETLERVHHTFQRNHYLFNDIRSKLIEIIKLRNWYTNKKISDTDQAFINYLLNIDCNDKLTDEERSYGINYNDNFNLLNTYVTRWDWDISYDLMCKSGGLRANNPLEK